MASLLRNEKIQRAAAILLILIFIAVCRLSIRRSSLTSDEAKHYQYGSNILALESDRFDDSKMPFSALNAFPKHLSQWAPAGTLQALLANFQTARSVTILFSALAAWLVFHWSKRLFGPQAGFLSLFLFILDPNIIAHSALVTTDIFMMGMGLATLYGFWRYLDDPNRKNLLLAAALFGLSHLAKYTSIILVPILLIVHFLHLLDQWSTREQKDSALLRVQLSRAAAAWAVMLAASLLIINTGFLFNRTLTPLNEYAFRSELFQAIQEVPVLGNLRVPLPYPYLDGLDWVRYRERTGAGYGAIYLLGNLKKGAGFPGYYLVATLLKLPIPALLIVGAALAAYVRKFDLRAFFQRGVFLLVPVLFFTLYFNFFYRAQIGIRFYLIIFPFLYVLCGTLLEGRALKSKQQKTLLAILVCWQLISVFSYFPHFIPYFNEIVWDRKDAYRFLADSNLDWEQGKLYLDDFVQMNPQTRLNPSGPTNGLIVVSPNQLLGITVDERQFAWLRDNFEPESTIAYEYLVYRISPEELEAVLSP